VNAEIIAIGTELLLGQIANTNAQTISQMLPEVGANVYFHTVVGDNLARIHDVLEIARGRSDVIVITGGLGPTPDDLTREAVAASLGVGLERDEELAEGIRAVFTRLGREMPEDNLRQSDLPVGATPIPQEGTAPGFVIDAGGVTIFALPGVPWEMVAMMRKTVLPELRRRAGSGVILSRQVVVVGLGESATHQAIADIVASQTNPTIAFLAGGGEVRVRMTAAGPDAADANALIDPLEKSLRERLGDFAIPGDHASVADALIQMLIEGGLTVAAAESLTGGAIAQRLTAEAGASAYFKGSLVTYSTQSKHTVAHVPWEVLDGPGAVSEEAAASLAEAAAREFDADLGLGATGVAGPNEQEGKPVGTVFVAGHFRGRTEVRHVRAYGDRDHIRRIAMTSSCDLGRRLLQGL
jgi:nicotinamide-nucleotide amidase